MHLALALSFGSVTSSSVVVDLALRCRSSLLPPPPRLSSWRMGVFAYAVLFLASNSVSPLPFFFLKLLCPFWGRGVVPPVSCCSVAIPPSSVFFSPSPPSTSAKNLSARECCRDDCPSLAVRFLLLSASDRSFSFSSASASLHPCFYVAVRLSVHLDRNVLSAKRCFREFAATP